MSLANDDLGPLNRIRELEEENNRLRQDVIELRRELEDRSAQFLRPDIGRRTSDFSPADSYRGDSNATNTAAWGEFDYKKSGRLSTGSDPDRDYLLVCPPPSLQQYLSNSLSTSVLQARPQTLSRNSMPPPPPLHIPSLQYSGNSQPQQQQPRALYPQQNGTLTYPVTSPTSSSSSPSYSVNFSPSFDINELANAYL